MATQVTFIDDSGITRFEGSMTPDPAAPGDGFTLPAVVDASALPTVDPAVAGQLWSNTGVVTVSAG